MTTIDTEDPAFSPLRAPTKADAVYDEIRTRIIDTRLTPGSRLDQETLAASLGISTTPLREALRRLEAEHLVERGAHKQVVITPLSRVELAELYTVRIELDPLAVRLAAAAAAPEELARARDTLNLPDQSDGFPASLRRNRAFHRTLYVASHNAVLIEQLDWLYDRSDRYRYVLKGEHQKLSAAHTEHHALVDAIAAGAADQAGQIMRTHVVESAASIDELIAAQADQVHLAT